MSTKASDPTTLNSSKKKILVVDDVITNVKIVSSMLSKDGFGVIPVTSGAEALQKLESLTPDLILLDLMMPDMDGVETCQRILSQKRFRNIPVIFLTASAQDQDLARAFHAGACDYVLKPCDRQELALRVKTHMDLREAKTVLEIRNEELSSLNEEKNDLLNMLAHDLKNPISNVMNLSEMILFEVNSKQTDLVEMLELVSQAAETMLGLINNVLRIRTLEEGQLEAKLEAVPLQEFIEAAAREFGPAAKAKGIHLSVSFSKENAVVRADKQLLTQVVHNLLSNAIKFSPADKGIFLEVGGSNRKVNISVRDEGPGIHPDEKDQLFKKFAKISNKPTGKETSNGLGLSIVKKLVDMMGGSIECYSELGEGTVFTVGLTSAEARSAVSPAA